MPEATATWRLRPDLIRVAVPPATARMTEAGLWTVPPSRELPALFGVVTQVGSRVVNVKPGNGVIFGSHVGQWVDGDLLIAETDVDAVVE